MYIYVPCGESGEPIEREDLWILSRPPRPIERERSNSAFCRVRLDSDDLEWLIASSKQITLNYFASMTRMEFIHVRDLATRGKIDMETVPMKARFLTEAGKPPRTAYRKRALNACASIIQGDRINALFPWEGAIYPDPSR